MWIYVKIVFAFKTHIVYNGDFTKKIQFFKATNKNEYTCGNSISRIYLETLLKVTHEPIKRIISKQLDIKLGPFTQEGLDSVPRKIENQQDSMKFSQKYRRLHN